MFKVPTDRAESVQTVAAATPKTTPVVTPRLPLQERHDALTTVLSQLTLKPEHRQDLVNRGLADDQIDALGFRSIERRSYEGARVGLSGFNATHYVGWAGYILPIRTLDGLLAGFQVKTDKGPKYGWNTDPQLPNGECPLQFLPGTTDEIFLPEGTIGKPAIINATTGAMTVGAMGGQWASCPEQITALVNRYPQAKFTLLPDAGAVQNPDVMRQYQRTADLFTSLNVELGFQWWDQLDKDVDLDADETAFWRNGSRLLSPEFFSDAFSNSCSNQLLVREQIAPVDHTVESGGKAFLPENAVYTTQPVLAIQAPMGSGKTELIKGVIHSDSTRTLGVTHRRNLSRNAAARVQKQPYVEEGATFDPVTGQNAFGLDTAGGDWSCIDSWHPRSSLKRTAEEIDGSRVVLDEVDQVLQHALTASTCISERADILATLQKGLPKAKQLIGASATLDAITVEWLEATTGKPVHVHRHNSTGGKWDHVFLESKAHAIGQIIKAITSGQNVLIATSDTGDDAKGSEIGAHNLLGTIRQQCGGLDETNSDAFTSASIAAGEQDSRQKLFMRDPVSAVRDLRVAIYSPVAETGIDINLKGHFDAVFVLSSGLTMTPQGVVQSAARLRDPDATRFFYVPESSWQQEGHGLTDWRELLSVTLKNQTTDQSLLAVLRSNVLRHFVPADECPNLRAWAKFQIRNELSAQHYRFVVQELLKHFGSTRKVCSVTTTADRTAAKEVRRFVKEKKSEADLAVITAPMPATPEFEAASREQKIAGRRRQKIELTTGKRLHPENTSEAEVGQLEKARGPLKLRHLLQNPELASTIDREAARTMTGFEGDTRRLTAAKRINHLRAMGAHRILQPGMVLTGKHPDVVNLNQYLAENARELSLLFGKKAKHYSQPMRAVSWLAELVGLKTQDLGKVRREGRQVHEYRLLESFDAVDVSQVLSHWDAHPELITGVKRRNEEPSLTLKSGTELPNKKDTTASFVPPVESDLPEWATA